MIIRRVLPARRVESRGKRRSLPRREGHDDDYAKCVFPFCVRSKQSARKNDVFFSLDAASFQAIEEEKKNVKKA